LRGHRPQPLRVGGIKISPQAAASRAKSNQSLTQRLINEKVGVSNQGLALKPVRTFHRTLLDATLIAGFAAGSLFAAASLALAPKNPAAGVAVVFSPWTNAAAALARATDPGSRFVRYGQYPFIVIVVPEAQDYLARVSAEGALFVLDPEALAACLGTFTRGTDVS